MNIAAYFPLFNSHFGTRPQHREWINAHQKSLNNLLLNFSGAFRSTEHHFPFSPGPISNGSTYRFPISQFISGAFDWESKIGWSIMGRPRPSHPPPQFGVANLTSRIGTGAGRERVRSAALLSRLRFGRSGLACLKPMCELCRNWSQSTLVSKLEGYCLA